MTKREWLDHLIVQFSPPPAPPRDDRVARAERTIQAQFGKAHHRAAQTCIDVLHALVKISKEKGLVISRITQRDIGQLCPRYKSGSTVGRYTKRLKELGLISIQHGGMHPNIYTLTFLQATCRPDWEVYQTPTDEELHPYYVDYPYIPDNRRQLKE